MRFEDDSIESAKVVKQWNVKIISVSNLAIDTNNFLAFALFLFKFPIVVMLQCTVVNIMKM